MKFADVKNDVAFRKIFGNKKKTHILVSFLNAVLQLEGATCIVAVKIENPYLLPRIAGEKSSIIDVRATEASGRQFIVEMQVAEPVGFEKRVLYYASREYSMQINRGDSYTKLKPTVFIGILNFKYFKGSDYLSYHSLLDEKTFENKLKDMRFAFIELPKFKKSENDLHNMIDKWTYFMKNATKLAMIPENVDDEGLKDAYTDADQHSWTKKELKDYDNSFIAEQDAKGVMALAITRATEQATEQATINTKIEMAQKLKAMGLTLADIQVVTGLSAEEIENV